MRSTLRLTEATEGLRRYLHASARPQSEVIVIAATDKDADHARQIAQEAAVVFAQLVDARFGSGTPELHAATLDSAHVLGGADRKDRLRGVNDRERAVAGRVGKLAAREKEVEERQAKLSAQEHEFSTRSVEVDAAKRELGNPAATPPPEPEPVVLVSEPVPQAPPTPRTGAWNMSDLQLAVDAQENASPEKAEEWRTYLFFLREHATAEGALPAQFDGLIEDVFGELL